MPPIPLFRGKPEKISAQKQLSEANSVKFINPIQSFTFSGILNQTQMTVPTYFSKVIRSVLFIAVISMGFTSCKKDPIEPSDSINKIMPLGASRVEGARPQFESFRYELWKLLTDGEWDFDYIGTEKDPASYPDYANETFDSDHEGRGGWTSGMILGEIEESISRTGSPDIVLFSSPAGNDALQGEPYNEAISNINAIIDILQDNNANVTIILEQMAPGRTADITQDQLDYFNMLQQDMLDVASQQSTSTSQVLTVDMFTGFTDSLLADEVHYNEAGASFIADRYYDVLKDLLK